MIRLGGHLDDFLKTLAKSTYGRENALIIPE
jgi:hypothetical protein